jgi:hypothetical protein
MKTCVVSCALLEHSTLNMYRSEKYFEQTLQIKTKHIIYDQYTFSVNAVDFETTELK